MKEFMVRKLPSDTLARLDDFASKANVSREQYVRELLITHAVTKEVAHQQKNYEELVLLSLNIIEKNTTAMKEMEELIYGKTIAE